MNCRLCHVPLRAPILSLGSTALANEFLKEPVVQDEFPLNICQCFECGHYQLDASVDPERLFRHYLYVAGTSKVNVEHFAKYASETVYRCRLSPGDFVIDIASNDGTLLKEFKKLGMRVLGVDPARNLAAAANADGIETIPEFFTEELAKKIAISHGKAALITANNVLAHTDEIEEITKGVKHLLAPNGDFAFEVSYFLDVVDNMLFDTIYHEHSSYHLVAPLVSFFGNLGMTFYDVAHLPNHGGSIRGFVSNGKCNVRDSIAQAVTDEVNAGLLSDDARINNFAFKVKCLRLEVLDALKDLKKRGKSVAVYGMPAKATTLCYAFGLDTSLIDFAVDDAVLKQGTFSPGKHIPVLHPDAIYERKPDAILVLAWNFASSIIENHKAYPGEWLVPLGVKKACL